MIRAVTFDFWNTLYQFPTEVDMSKRRAEKLLQILNNSYPDLTLENVIKGLIECWKHANRCQRVKGYDITPAGHLNYILEYLNIKVSSELWQVLYECYTTILEENPPLVCEGVRTTLPAIAQTCKLAVICNTGGTPGSILRKIMKKDDLLDYFNFLVFSDEVGWAKPNIHIFKYALDGINVNAEQAVHIGDDPITDVMGAKNAGMKSIWLDTQANRTVPECDYHVQNVAELLTIIGGRE